MIKCETCPSHSGERIVLTHKGNNLCLDCFHQQAEDGF